MNSVSAPAVLTLAMTFALWAAMVGCSAERQLDPAGGVHPRGWANDTSAEFHGRDLAARAYPLSECKECHGGDLAGGVVASPCSSADCHPGGVDACTTCHGDGDEALPANGAHAAHRGLCIHCHQQPQTGPTRFDVPPHLDGAVDVTLTGAAKRPGYQPSWDSDSRTCSDVYCHLGDTPPWDDPAPLGCAGCHPIAPAHDRFDRVVSEQTCAQCHAGSPAVGHIDGSLAIAIAACDACHGRGRGAPWPALDGSLDPTDRAVGAHVRHLDRALADRIGKAVLCQTCHRVPEELFAAGHLDSTPPADVDVVAGEYDPNALTCRVWCHGDSAPVWTDASGEARACDACHGFPPQVTRTGSRHVPTPAQLDECTRCHLFASQTHVDGEVTLR